MEFQFSCFALLSITWQSIFMRQMASFGFLPLSLSRFVVWIIKIIRARLWFRSNCYPSTCSALHSLRAEQKGNVVTAAAARIEYIRASNRLTHAYSQTVKLQQQEAWSFREVLRKERNFDTISRVLLRVCVACELMNEIFREEADAVGKFLVRCGREKENAREWS